MQVNAGFDHAVAPLKIEPDRMPDTNLKAFNPFAIDESEMERSKHEDLELDLGSLEMKSQISDSFDDLIASQAYKTGLLFPLTEARLKLQSGGTLALINNYRGEIDEIYLRNLNVLLTAAGFFKIQVEPRDGVQYITAERRPLITRQYRFNMTFRELVKPSEILRSHEFAQEIFYYRDNNYDIELSRQFDLSSDIFAVFDGSGQIVSMGRAHTRVPGYYPPFMYAVLEKSGEHVTVPDNFVRLLEVMSVYREGKFGVIAFKRLIEDLFQYGYEVAGYDSAWTTYDASDQYTGTYYKTRFLFEEFGARLMYRDFGGSWNLIYTDRIKENCENRSTMFP